MKISSRCGGTSEDRSLCGHSRRRLLWAGLAYGFDVVLLFRRRLFFGDGRRGRLFTLEQSDVV
jgi:hypothetical protein